MEECFKLYKDKWLGVMCIPNLFHFNFSIQQIGSRNQLKVKAWGSCSKSGTNSSVSTDLGQQISLKSEVGKDDSEN